MRGFIFLILIASSFASTATAQSRPWLYLLIAGDSNPKFRRIQADDIGAIVFDKRADRGHALVYSSTNGLQHLGKVPAGSDGESSLAALRSIVKDPESRWIKMWARLDGVWQKPEAAEAYGDMRRIKSAHRVTPKEVGSEVWEVGFGGDASYWS